jgi:hypothetical protein
VGGSGASLVDEPLQKLLVKYEKKGENYQAVAAFACAISLYPVWIY